MAMTTDSMTPTEVVTGTAQDFAPPAEPRARELTLEARILFDKSIIARPLIMPEAAEIRVKNHDYQYRWVFCGGTRGTEAGNYNYRKRLAQGYTNATPEDVEVYGPEVAKEDGLIRTYDVVLMKIPCALIFAHYKANMLKAAALMRMRGVWLDGGSSDVFSDGAAKRVSVKQEPFVRASGLKFEIPDDPDRLVEESIKSGRVAKTRAVVDSLRQKPQ